MGGHQRGVLIVGAGFAGAVYARVLAEAGIAVDVIDKRRHVAGNCYDEAHDSGVRYHCYGPHLFHTSIERVIAWVTRFGSFVPYAHSVSVQLDAARFVPLPINVDTLNIVFSKNLRSEAEAAAFVATLAAPATSERNAGEYLASRLGETLTDTFFRPYTKKMWGLDLEEMDAAVVKRIPIRYSRESRYFPEDTFQALPRDGYAALFAGILDHDLITVRCNTAYERAMSTDYAHTFNSMPIDEFHDYRFGALPYRSIRFHHEVVSADRDTGPTSVVNFSDASRYTRRTDWDKFPSHRLVDTGKKLLTTEEPCDYALNDFERYYPVRDASGENDAVLRQYQRLAATDDTMTFIGRCGTYQYLDMHQVINQSLLGAEKWLERRMAAAASNARIATPTPASL